jgi:cyanate lyase
MRFIATIFCTTGDAARQEDSDGITSAIDFDMVMERLPDPKGDRVKITMSGKFLPFKYYGATGERAGLWV